MSLEAPFFSFDREINRVVLLWNTSGVPPWICRFHRWGRSISSKLTLLWQKSSLFCPWKMTIQQVKSTSSILKKPRSKDPRDVDQQVNLFHAHSRNWAYSIKPEIFFFSRIFFPRDIHQNSSKKDTTNASKNSVFLKANFGFCSARNFPHYQKTLWGIPFFAQKLAQGWCIDWNQIMNST